MEIFYKKKIKFILLGIGILLVFGIVIGFFTNNKEITGVDEVKGRKVIEEFIENINKKDSMKINSLLIDGERVENLIIGYKDLESIEITEIKNNKYDEYCKNFFKNKKEDKVHTSFTVKLKYKYLEKSNYESGDKELIVFLEKYVDKWKIYSAGPSNIIGFLN